MTGLPSLVSPPLRSSAGYRLYGPQDEGRLRFVRQAKGLGFSLDDIRALMAAAERGCCGEVVPALLRDGGVGCSCGAAADRVDVQVEQRPVVAERA